MSPADLQQVSQINGSALLDSDIDFIQNMNLQYEWVNLDADLLKKKVYANDIGVSIQQYENDTTSGVRLRTISNITTMGSCVLHDDSLNNNITHIFILGSWAHLNISSGAFVDASGSSQSLERYNPLWDEFTNPKTLRKTIIIYNLYYGNHINIVEYGCWLNGCRSIGIHISDGYRVIFNDYQDPTECECLLDSGVPTYVSTLSIPGYIYSPDIQ